MKTKKQFTIYTTIGLLLLTITSFAFTDNDVFVSEKGTTVSIENALVCVSYDLSKGCYSAFNKMTNKTCITEAFFYVNIYVSTNGFSHKWTEADVNDELGTGKKIVIKSAKKDSIEIILEITLYKNKGFFVVNCGVVNTTGKELRIMKFSPLNANAFQGFTFNGYKTLDGESDDYQTKASSADTLKCHNNLLVTFGEMGKAKNSLVIGGLTYNEFRKFTSVVKLNNCLNISVLADDPVGKLVDNGSEFISKDKFYVDFTTSNRFEALEKYGIALRDANHCRTSGVNYPILSMWYSSWEHGGNDINKNNTPGSVWAMEDAIKSGINKYCKVGIRLEPDDYSTPNNQQGWWDNEHFQKYKSGGFMEPFETAEKWGSAIKQLGGIPFIYSQTGKRSEDYARTFPQHILFNDPFKLRSRGRVHNESYWGYDYTDPGFINHMKEVYQNFKKSGVKGIKFDYPETGWAYDGGLEDKYATAASAYRNIFKLAYEGLGDSCDVQERLPRDGDVALGTVTTMRSLGDGDFMYPPFAAKTGLRWYKNRVIVNYDNDAKNPYHGVPENSRDGVRAMFTMTSVTSGRLEVGKYFSYMTKDQLYDISRILPMYETPKSARPIDGFTCAEYPRIFDFDVNSQWHILTFYNTASKGDKWPVYWPEWYKPLKTIPVESMVSVKLDNATDEGGLGLDSRQSYYIWDFWNWKYVGKLPGTDELKQLLRPGEARVFAIHEAKKYPQFISTNRHIMQGYVDMIKYPEWNRKTKDISGISKVIGGEPYKIVIALNGFKIPTCEAKDAQSELKIIDSKNGLMEFTINTSENKDVEWYIHFK